MTLKVVRTVAELRRRLGEIRRRKASVALVPTMGALHEGHLSLVRLAGSAAETVVASLFVNPAQFSPDEDFAAYPRNERRDVKLLSANGCELIFAPAKEEVYPPGFTTSVSVGGAADLEGRFRSHHFSGVATVVAKLLIQFLPDVAVFGEKDYQQLLVVRRLTRDLDLPVRILGGPIVRDADGLALSSRNAYLSADQRRIAPALHRALAQASRELASGRSIRVTEAKGRAALLEAGFDSVDYFEVRGADNLRRLGRGRIQTSARVLAAAKIGRIRLIDNESV